MVSVVPNTLVPVTSGILRAGSPVTFKVTIKKDMVDILSPSTTVILYGKASDDSTWTELDAYTCSKCMSTSPFQITFAPVTVQTAGEWDFGAVDSSDADEINIPSSTLAAFKSNMLFGDPVTVPDPNDIDPIIPPDINTMLEKYGLYIAVGGIALVALLAIRQRKSSPSVSSYRSRIRRERSDISKMESKLASEAAKLEEERREREEKQREREQRIMEQREEDERRLRQARESAEQAWQDKLEQTRKELRDEQQRERERWERERDISMQRERERELINLASHSRAQPSPQNTSMPSSPMMMGGPVIAYPPNYNRPERREPITITPLRYGSPLGQLDRPEEENRDTLEEED